MSDTPKTPLDAPQPLSKTRLAIEVGVVFAISLVLTRVFSDLAGLNAIFGEYLHAAVAAVFLVLPYFVLTRRRRDFEAHAMTWSGWQKGLLVAGVVTLLTALPFFVGYHYWRTAYIGHTFAPSADNYFQLPLQMEGRPPTLAQKGKNEVLIWRDGQDVTVQWATPARAHNFQLDLKAEDGHIEVLRGRQHARDPRVRRGDPIEGVVTLRTTSRAPLVRYTTFRVHDAPSLQIGVRVNGRPPPAGTVMIGPGRAAPRDVGAWSADAGTLTLDRSIGWLPLIILTQLLLIAFPEEFFYRGYLQTTLERILPWKLDLKIAHTSAAILISSALFAIGHFVINLHPARLAVFFPSLMFGYLKDRTQTIVACIVYHAACNLMVEAISPHYIN